MKPVTTPTDERLPNQKRAPGDTGFPFTRRQFLKTAL